MTQNTICLSIVRFAAPPWCYHAARQRQADGVKKLAFWQTTISMHTKLSSVVFLFALAFGITASASGIDLSGNKRTDISEAEWAMAPPYCPYTMGQKGHKQPFIHKWVAIMGDGFFHMHHYCWALFDFHRAERSDLSPLEKRTLLNRALGGFRYVVRNTTDDFVVLPEIYTWMGRTELLLRRPKEASESFASAWRLKADYWPPYYHWAEFLQRNGKKAEALEVIKSGLRFSPRANTLLLYRQLGGNPSDITPPEDQSNSELTDTRVKTKRPQDNHITGNQ